MKKLKLTKEETLAQIKHESYTRIGKKTMVCCLTLHNGFEVIGDASCISPENFDIELGRKFSYEDAVNKLGVLVAYKVHCDFDM